MLECKMSRKIHTCDGYVGVNCVRGLSCPFTLEDYTRNHEYLETQEVSKQLTCLNCWQNKGCEDCYFANTEMCLERKK